ncbi:hypothetical protein [Vampirovibrio chlorellavorus]|uniref:hypothetical protein n=1 Tax=Vampirovibrio chlorellavorus TaxID=758823 RepID=UPI0026F273AD|nr:hypothetical protein [Vampirovibrio chlorellavorus]
MADLKAMLSQMIQMPAKSRVGQPSQPAASGAKKAIDALSGFSAMLKNGEIRSNLNQPALPYTATKSWVA